MNSNRSLGERCADALMEAGAAKAAALKAERLAARVLDRLFLSESGTVDARKAAARTHPTYTNYEDEATEAESRAIIAKAAADACMVQFEEWRTNEASRRQDSKFIGAGRA